MAEKTCQNHGGTTKKITIQKKTLQTNRLANEKITNKAEHLADSTCQKNLHWQIECVQARRTYIGRQAWGQKNLHWWTGQATTPKWEQDKSGEPTIVEHKTWPQNLN